jgi:tetraacyldisaccharide 4'-kinase
MASEAPPFWWEKADWRAYALYPVSLIYGAVAAHRMANARREKVAAPVLCIGNFTVGGTGKTPMAIALAKQAKRMNLTPGFLSRGHGGGFSKPHVVDTHHDSARHVGDEPLLLAEHGPVAVTPNRAEGARLLIEQGCDFLIMDDGFQSARIHMDYALVVVDGRHGVGNGYVIPAGPLRASVVDQVRYATALVTMGGDNAGDAVIRQAARGGRTIYEASTEPRNAERFAKRRFLAFAGIGHPDRFFDTITKAGGTVALSRTFADHHFYTEEELDELALTANKADLELVTTAKDAARMRHGLAPRAFVDRLNVLEIDAVFENRLAAQRIVEETLDAWRLRKLRG